MNYAQIAAAVYQACNHFDPYLPALSPELARAWGRQFEKYQLPAELLLKGVDKVYEEHGSGYRPLPKDITEAARAIRKDRRDRQTDRSDLEAICNSKAADDAALAAIIRRTGLTVGKGVEGAYVPDRPR